MKLGRQSVHIEEVSQRLHGHSLREMSSDAIEWHRILKFQRYPDNPGTVVG